MISDSYLTILQEIRVWGSRLWNYLPGDSRWHDGQPIAIDGYKVQTGSYALSNGGMAKAMTVNHPSVGYSWDWWYRAIKEFLK